MLWGHVNSYSPSFLSPWSCLSCNGKLHNKKVNKEKQHFGSRQFLVIGKASGNVVGVGKISGRGSSILCAVAKTFALKWTHTIQNCLTHWWIGWMVTGCEDLTEMHLIYWAPPCSLESLSDSETLSIRELSSLTCSFSAGLEGWFLCIPCEIPPSPSSHGWVTSAKLHVIQLFPGNRNLKTQERQTSCDVVMGESHKVCAALGNWTWFSGNQVVPLGHPAYVHGIHMYIKGDLK